MAPTMDAPVVRRIDGDRHLDALKSGLVPYSTKDLQKADRCPLGDHRQVGNVQSRLRRAPVPCGPYYEWRDDPACPGSRLTIQKD
jgi:putative SOS response-associated peptidase YedK